MPKNEIDKHLLVKWSRIQIINEKKNKQNKKYAVISKYFEGQKIDAKGSDRKDKHFNSWPSFWIWNNLNWNGRYVAKEYIMKTIISVWPINKKKKMFIYRVNALNSEVNIDIQRHNIKQ